MHLQFWEQAHYETRMLRKGLEFELTLSKRVSDSDAHWEIALLMSKEDDAWVRIQTGQVCIRSVQDTIRAEELRIQEAELMAATERADA